MQLVRQLCGQQGKNHWPELSRVKENRHSGITSLALLKEGYKGHSIHTASCLVKSFLVFSRKQIFCVRHLCSLLNTRQHLAAPYLDSTQAQRACWDRCCFSCKRQHESGYAMLPFEEYCVSGCKALFSSYLNWWTYNADFKLIKLHVTIFPTIALIQDLRHMTWHGSNNDLM